MAPTVTVTMPLLLAALAIGGGAAMALGLMHFFERLTLRVLRKRVVDAAPKPAKSPPTALFVTSHPDDEAMFFSPSITGLLMRKWQVELLVLSKGLPAPGFDDRERGKEVVAAAKKLGIERQNVLVVDDPRLVDGMQTQWKPADVAGVIRKHLKYLADTNGRRPDVVVSFDDDGVSGHPNHCATAAGVRLLAKERKPAPPLVYCLRSVPLYRKYTSFWDGLWSAKDFIATTVRAGQTTIPPVVVTTGSSPLVSHQAMACHKSQYVWYRRLFVLFSRYSMINTLERVQ